jgi:hypothetical protein
MAAAHLPAVIPTEEAAEAARAADNPAAAIPVAADILVEEANRAEVTPVADTQVGVGDIRVVITRLWL